MCVVCEAGHYCGSAVTSALKMYTGGGSWDAAFDDAGVCFNGTYCAAGMDRAPGVVGWKRRGILCFLPKALCVVFPLIEVEYPQLFSFRAKVHAWDGENSYPQRYTLFTINIWRVS